MPTILILMSTTILILFICYMVRNAFQNQVIENKLHFPTFPSELESFTVFFISDVHRRKINPSIIHSAKGKADLVIIGGDLLEKGVPFPRVEENLKKLKSIAPVVFVWGNNDYEVNQERFLDLLKKTNIKILKNEIIPIDKKLNLIGVDDLSQEPQLEEFFLQIEKDAFNILISHNPDTIHMIPDEITIPIVLSGHTHGGQIRIFGFGPFQKGGVKKIKNTILLISNGYGTTVLPLRLGAKSETHLVTIRNEQV